MPPETLHTDRLTGRPARTQDWPFLLALQRDPRSGPWITRPGTGPTERGAQATCARMAAHWAAHGFGVRVWEGEGAPLVIAGLRHQLLEGRAVVEALWTVRPDRWREGLATEAMRETLAADAPEVRAIEAWTLPTNAPSRALAVTLGFRGVGVCLWVGLPHLLFRLKRR